MRFDVCEGFDDVHAHVAELLRCVSAAFAELARASPSAPGRSRGRRGRISPSPKLQRNSLRVGIPERILHWVFVVAAVVGLALNLGGE
jgi:hypothetical protein